MDQPPPLLVGLVVLPARERVEPVLHSVGLVLVQQPGMLVQHVDERRREVVQYEVAVGGAAELGRVHSETGSMEASSWKPWSFCT